MNDYESVKIVSAPIRMSPELMEKVSEAVKRTGWKQAEILRQCLEIGLEDLKSCNYDVPKIVADIARSYRSSTSSVTPFRPKPDVLAAAGPPISAEVTDWDGADNTVMVKISGLSMVPLLNDGDIVPMRHKRASRNPFMKKGLIYLVEYDSGYTVKRYNTRPATPEEKGEEWVEKGKVKVLESINKDYPEIVIKQPIEWIAWLDKADNQ